MSIPRNAPPLSHIAAGPRPAPVNRINLLEAVSRGSARAQLPTPIGPIRRRPGGFLPESPAPEFRFQRAGDQTKSRAAELARVGKMTSITQILSLLSRPTSYRTYSHGMALLVDGIRQLSLQKQFSVANRFGCATAEDLANRLLFLFRKKGLEEKALEVAAQRKAGTKRKPQGRIWAAGGGFWEEIVRMDEALTASRPIGIVQNSSVIGDSGKRVIREDTFKTPKDVEVTRLSVGVDVELHDKLLELVFISGRLIR